MITYITNVLSCVLKYLKYWYALYVHICVYVGEYGLVHKSADYTYDPSHQVTVCELHRNLNEHITKIKLKL